MRIAEVIGSVTLSREYPTLTGARWLIAVPCSLNALKHEQRGDGEDLVVYDNLGAGRGCLIGLSEGVEAAAPFQPIKVPLDAFCGCILDRVVVSENHE